jgi:hypothetical protein
MLSIVWSTASSLLIHNTGIPIVQIFSINWILLGITFGWLAIKSYELRLVRQAAFAVQTRISKLGLSGKDNLLNMINKEKGVIEAHQSFAARITSNKAVHGILMALSWANIAMRFASGSGFQSFSCNTFPAWKPLNGMSSPRNITMVPEIDPEYGNKPWAGNEYSWVTFQLLFPLCLASLLGSIVAFYESRREQRDTDWTEFGLDAGSPAIVKTIDLSPLFTPDLNSPTK